MEYYKTILRAYECHRIISYVSASSGPFRALDEPFDKEESFIPSAEHFDYMENKDAIADKGKKISIKISAHEDLEMTILKV